MTARSQPHRPRRPYRPSRRAPSRRRCCRRPTLGTPNGSAAPGVHHRTSSSATTAQPAHASTRCSDASPWESRCSSPERSSPSTSPTSSHVGAVTVLASALAVVAVGLLVGAYVGRSRGLIALGVVLVLALIPLGALPDDIRWNAGSGAGERVYRVTSPGGPEGGVRARRWRAHPRPAPTRPDRTGRGRRLSRRRRADRGARPMTLPVSATADVAVGVIEHAR